MKCFNSYLLRREHRPCLSSVEHDVCSEHVTVPLGDNTYAFREVPIVTYSEVTPVMEIETDLQAIIDSGVLPQQVNVSNLLSPDNPSSREALAHEVLAGLALDIRESERLSSNIQSELEPSESSESSESSK